jgi:hypothetical protein
LLLDDDRSEVGTPSTTAQPGVFSTATNTVLLFSDGTVGATAVDLDRRVAGRRVIEGERAGDQALPSHTDRRPSVVGWAEIYAAPLTGRSSTKIDDATSTCRRPSLGRCGRSAGRVGG